MRDVDVAIAVALEGAAVVRRRFGTLLGRVDKGRGDFATEADIEAEQAMTSLLRIERPKDAVLGEETGRGGGASEARIWLIDPLRGTMNYAAAMRVAAVNAALVVDGACRAAAGPWSRVVWSGYVDGRAEEQRRRNHGETRQGQQAERDRRRREGRRGR
jgi:myo-inositol-1(or 4)-monophosphatase